MRSGKRQAALTPVAAPRCIIARALDKTVLNLWFAREVLVHEAALIRYLMRVWPNHHEVHDLRQEIYVRVYEAARQQHPVSAKAFLFSTARNLIIDRVRRSRIVTIQSVGDLAGFDVLVDELTPERRLSASQEFSLLARAFRRLPLREREVIWLRRVDGLAQKDVAARLSISEKTVETHLRRGMQKMADAFFAGKAWRERCRPRRIRGTKPVRGGSHENDYGGKRQSS
jgi:RNA polymerase sigma factor (sigma-70 family)